MGLQIIIAAVVLLITFATSRPIVNVNIEDKCCDQAGVNGTGNPIVNVNVDDKCCDDLDVKKIADAVCSSTCACADMEKSQYILEFCKEQGLTLSCPSATDLRPT